MQLISLDEKLDFFNGKSIPKKEITLDQNVDFKVYGSNGVIGFSEKFNHENSIVIGRVGAYCGSVQYEVDKFWATDNTIVCRAKDLKDLAYFYYLLDFMNLNQHAGGAAQPLLTQSVLNMLRVSIHESKERFFIGDFFSNIDESINLIRKQISIYEKLIEGHFKEWFINFKFPYHEQVNFVDGIPAGWKECCLKEVIKTNPSTMKKGEFENILYVDISSVGEGEIESVTKYSPTYAPGRAKRKVQHGDVIWSCVRPNRKQFALIQNPQENLIVSTGFTVLRPTKIPFSFLASIAASDDFSGYLTSVAQGAAYPAVTYKDFEEFGFLLPTDDLLDEYHKITQPMYEQVNVLQKQSDKLRELKATLLPRLMSGELDVSKLTSIE
ncbi:restriction endonuclease subunit S [Acinetobacter pragensis]|uniref:restriction endonuclease subunit S n=1 Tax=Acinetobacter pragensis TaxID=1806892 RepID=UPI0033412F78